MREQPFLDLIRTGYIGAYSATTEPLMVLVRAVLERGRAVVAAIQTPKDQAVTRYEAAELQQAKERIGSLFGETGAEMALEGDAGVDAVIAALLEKARAKLDVVGDEDRRELIDLMEAVRDTQAADDAAALDQVRGQLADLLFYLET